jgi:hypothetical protein
MLIYCKNTSKITKKQKAKRDERIRIQNERTLGGGKSLASKPKSVSKPVRKAPGVYEELPGTLYKRTVDVTDPNRIPSLNLAEVPLPPVRESPRYEGEMAEREAAAQAEAERRKSQTAPLYSKGAYQYITPDTDLTTLGRKV